MHFIDQQKLRYKILIYRKNIEIVIYYNHEK